MFNLTIADVGAILGLITLVAGGVSSIFLLRPRLSQMRVEREKLESDTDVQSLTSAAGAIDSAARSLKIMLDAVPGSKNVPEHQVASVIDATAQAMLAIINTLPRRVLAVENTVVEMRSELEDVRTQVAGLSKRPSL